MPSLLATLAATALAASTACAAERVPSSVSTGLRRQLRSEETSADTEADSDQSPDCPGPGPDPGVFLEENPVVATFGAAAIASDFDATVLLLGEPGGDTIFAPSNAAFEAIAGPDALVELSKDLDFLAEILANHAVDTALTTRDLTDGRVLTTAVGTELTVAVTAAGDVTIVAPNGAIAKVITPDVSICDSVGHIIDTVLLTTEQAATLAGEAPCGPQIFVQENPEASTFGAAAPPVDVDANVAALPPVTLFAPTNAAFEAIAGADALEKLGGDEDLLQEILAGHLVHDFLLAADFTDGQVLTTRAGTELTVALTADGGVTVVAPDGTVATVTKADISICSSIAHIIDAVLLTSEQAARLGLGPDDESGPTSGMPSVA